MCFSIKNKIFLMKFVVSSSALYAKLQQIKSVVPSKASLAILESFLFDIQGTTLTMTASDAETTLVTSMELVSSDSDGKVAIQSKLLLDTLAEFPEQPITFYIDNENLSIKMEAMNGNYNLIGQNGLEYPTLPTLSEDKQSIKMSAKVLRNGIQKTLFAAADDDMRPIMTGVYFDIATDKFTMVATDAHKLVRYTVCGVENESPTSFILSKKPANAILSVLKDEEEVKITFDSKNILIELVNFTLVCRQIEGKYPNYNAVIPTNNDKKIIVDRQSFLSAVRRVSIYANDATELMKFEISAGKMEISADDLEFSVAAKETMVCQYDGEPIRIGFKAKFIQSIVKNIDSNEIVISLVDSSRAGLILPVENVENTELLSLVMPMILND